MKFAKVFASAIALSAVSVGTAQAQAGTCGVDGVSGTAAVNATICNPTHVVSTTVSDILLLNITTGSTNLGAPTTANYGALAGNAYLTATPLAASAGPVVKVVANRAYEVSLTSEANFSTAPAGVTKPAGDVQWKNSTGSFVALTTTAGPGSIVLSGATGTADTNTALSFRSRWAFERDLPGNYAMTLTLTLAAK